MATVAGAPRGSEAQSPEHRFVLHGVAWRDYEVILAALGERPVRISYNRGTLEFMSPGPVHEEFGRLFGILIQAVSEELDVPCIGLKSTTWKKQMADRGLEPDECFYLANAGYVLARDKKIDLNVDPPPDLCIEVEITASAADRMDIYAGLAVPEVWRHDGESLRVAVLGADGAYVEGDVSPGLPFLPIADVDRLVKQGRGMDHGRWGKLVRVWLREAILPTLRPPEDRPG